VKPVLKAIMNEEFTGGLRRHELYVNGETSRLKLKNEGGLRGAVDARSVDEFLKLVELWCLGCRGRDFEKDENRTKEVQQPDVPSLNGDEDDGMQKPVESIPRAVQADIPVQNGALNKGPEPQVDSCLLTETDTNCVLRIPLWKLRQHKSHVCQR
jgi:hypothetical protein